MWKIIHYDRSHTNVGLWLGSREMSEEGGDKNGLPGELYSVHDA